MMEPSTDMESNEKLPDFMNEPFSEDYLDDPTVISLPGNLFTNRYENRNNSVTSLRTITYKGSFRKKKRIRRKEPKKKKHVEKRDNDVLLGRGGCANNHQGNKIYLQRILGLQKWYKTLPRDEKTNCSNSVVQWIHNRGGRFLKRENKRSRWYIVTPATARQKVSQALREDHTPEGRALKKSKAKSYKH